MIVTHFQSMVIFAVCVSLAFALLSKEGTGERIRYANPARPPQSW